MKAIADFGQLADVLNLVHRRLADGAKRLKPKPRRALDHNVGNPETRLARHATPEAEELLGTAFAASAVLPPLQEPDQLVPADQERPLAPIDTQAVF